MFWVSHEIMVELDSIAPFENVMWTESFSILP